MHERPGFLYDELTRSIIGAFYAAYNEMGFGLLESVYGAALDEELRRRGHHVDREFWVDVFYKGSPIARQRIDRLVDRKVVLEIKATEQLPPFAQRQLLRTFGRHGSRWGSFCTSDRRRSSNAWSRATGYGPATNRGAPSRVSPQDGGETSLERLATRRNENTRGFSPMDADGRGLLRFFSFHSCVRSLTGLQQYQRQSARISVHPRAF
jgi:GxxExxY protein